MRIVTFGIGGYDPDKPNNNIVDQHEMPDAPPVPLDPVGTLATLLAVLEVIPVEDAANAVSLAPAQLIAEAQAWAVAGIVDDTTPV